MPPIITRLIATTHRKAHSTHTSTAPQKGLSLLISHFRSTNNKRLFITSFSRSSFAACQSIGFGIDHKNGKQNVCMRDIVLRFVAFSFLFTESLDVLFFFYQISVKITNSSNYGIMAEIQNANMLSKSRRTERSGWMKGKMVSNSMIFQIVSNLGKCVSVAHRQPNTIQVLIHIRYGLMIVFKMWCAHDIDQYPNQRNVHGRTNHHPVGYEYDLRNLLWQSIIHLEIDGEKNCVQICLRRCH